MDIASFSQLGIGVATLAILWFVVKYFIEALTKKDDYISKIIEDFNAAINNHMKHETDAFNNLVKVIDKLTKRIDKTTKK